MLQRITEDFEYSNILDIAAQCKDPFEQLAYVAAFTISSYSTTVNRTSKPFNPLLGETYECDRMLDLGWRSFSEQVKFVNLFKASAYQLHKAQRIKRAPRAFYFIKKNCHRGI